MPDTNGNKWNCETLKEYIDATDKDLESRIDGYWKKAEIKFEAMDKAMDLFQANMNVKMEQQNEWRNQNKDILATLMPRNETQLLVDNLGKRIDYINQYVQQQTGKETGKKDMTATIISAISLIGVIFAIVLNLTKCVGG